jgi:hypothetical protein
LLSATITALVMLWANYFSIGPNVDLSYIFVQLFTGLDYPGAASLLVILLLAAFVPGRLAARRVLAYLGEHPIVIAALTTLLLCAGSIFIYRNHPLSMDEYAAYFQSQIFAAGHLAGHFPPELADWLIPSIFQGKFLAISHQTGAVASSYWPSFALLLAAFTKLGIPWACNPVISGCTLIAIHRLTQSIFGSVEASGAAVLFTLASPVFAADGISYYSMPAHLLTETLYALLLIRPTTARAAAAGVIGSVALTLHNPLPHLLFAVPWVLWVARRPDSAKLIGSLIAGYLPLSLLLGIGWFMYIGHLVPDATDHASGGAVAAVFSLPTCSILIARAVGVAKIWAWAVPGLLLLSAYGAWNWRQSELCRVLLASALLTLLGYCIVPFDQGHGWGYRYFHSAWMAVPILAAGALLPGPGSPAAGPSVADEAVTLVVACALLTLVLGVGFRLFQMRQFIDQHLSHQPPHSADGAYTLFLNPDGALYEVDLIQNDPWLRERVVRMRGHGLQQDAEMMARQFPQQRRLYWGRFGETWSPSPAEGPTRVNATAGRIPGKAGP